MAASPDKPTTPEPAAQNWDLVRSKLATKFPQVGEDALNGAAGDPDGLAEVIAAATGIDEDAVRTQIDAVMEETAS